MPLARVQTLNVGMANTRSQGSSRNGIVGASQPRTSWCSPTWTRSTDLDRAAARGLNLQGVTCGGTTPCDDGGAYRRNRSGSTRREP